jgi:hypothetical protein
MKRVRNRRVRLTDRVKLTEENLRRAGFTEVRDEKDKAEHKKKFGGFNDYPPNWKPCGQHEFWNKFFLFGVGHHEVRQMSKPKGYHLSMFRRGEPVGELTDARLFFYDDDTGLAMVPTSDLGQSNYITPRLFKFARCEHKWIVDRKKSKMHFTVSKCGKCGDMREVDSRE